MKKVIRLTENNLHRIIENSVKRVLKEEIMYHSEDKAPDSYERRVLWLCDNDEGQATMYGDIYKYDIDDDTNWADQFRVEDLAEDNDMDCDLYDPDDEIIRLLRENGYDGYWFENVDGEYLYCLINMKKARLIK